jgi:hypothetical protein
VPVTGAKYWAYGVAEAPNFVDLLVVNHARAHVCIAAGVEWQGEGGPAHSDSDGRLEPLVGAGARPRGSVARPADHGPRHGPGTAQ